MATAELARFIANTEYRHIPPEVIAVARNCVLDGMGVALAGSRQQAGQTIISYVKELGGKPEAGVIGGKFRTCASEAAMANGVLLHVLDYDDSVSGWGGHLTAAILPAVLALGERQDSSGQEVLAALAFGWEAGERIGDQIGFRLMQLDWHPHAVLGPLAAAAACAKLLKLDEKQTRIALGISASEAVGLRANFGTDTKPFYAGKGARMGVVAALLAQKGFTANESILEGDLGLARMFTHQELDSAKLSQGLGRPFALVSPGVAFKLHPSCGLTQRGINAMLELVREHRFRADDIAEIECQTRASIPQTLRFSRPQTPAEGKFSMQYCLAAAALDREVTLRQFTGEKVLSPAAQQLMERVKYRHPEDAEFDAADNIGFQAVTVRLKDGRQYSRRIDHARGEPENPVSQEEIIAKFRSCAELVISPPDIEATIDSVLKLDSLRRISRLTGRICQTSLSLDGHKR
ncbi:MAG: MmgE/PrpD family protein [Chloroflexi bacterium]|nr:MmgE/PrpD family protein [Chloroflexota bacterium]